MPDTVSVMSVITVYSVLRQLNSSHCWLQVMETTVWPPTHHLRITQERSWGATSLAFITRSTSPGWTPSPCSLNPLPEWVDVSRMLAGTSLTVSWVFSCVCLCVCCCQMETPVSSPYPRQRKKPSHQQKLSSEYSIYISPYNRAPSPHSSIFSYTFNSSSREVCEPRWSYNLGQCLNLLRFKCSFCFQQHLKEINNLLRYHTQPREGDEDEPLVRRPRWGRMLSLHQQLRDVQSDRMRAAQNWACVKKPKLQRSGQRCRVMPELWLR